MNFADFEEFKRLEDFLNKRIISPIDFWQRIRELKTISTGMINKIQRELFTLDAKQYNGKSVPLQETKYNFSQDIFIKNETSIEKLAKMAINQVPLVNITYNPEGHSHYIEPRTTGEKMLGKLDYKESIDEYQVMMMGNTNTNQRTFERMRAQVIDYIEFSKGVDGDIYFTSSLVRKTHALHSNPKEPKPVTKKELDAIIQIITEWMD